MSPSQFTFARSEQDEDPSRAASDGGVGRQRRQLLRPRP